MHLLVSSQVKYDFVRSASYVRKAAWPVVETGIRWAIDVWSSVRLTTLSLCVLLSLNHLQPAYNELGKVSASSTYFIITGPADARALTPSCRGGPKTLRAPPNASMRLGILTGKHRSYITECKVSEQRVFIHAGPFTVLCHAPDNAETLGNWLCCRQGCDTCTWQVMEDLTDEKSEYNIQTN